MSAGEAVPWLFRSPCRGWSLEWIDFQAGLVSIGFGFPGGGWSPIGFGFPDGAGLFGLDFQAGAGLWLVFGFQIGPVFLYFQVGASLSFEFDFQIGGWSFCVDFQVRAGQLWVQACR